MNYLKHLNCKFTFSIFLKDILLKTSLFLATRADWWQIQIRAVNLERIGWWHSIFRPKREENSSTVMDILQIITMTRLKTF